MCDFLEQFEFTESSICFIDDNNAVIQEFHQYLEEVSSVYIKLERKPNAGEWWFTRVDDDSYWLVRHEWDSDGILMEV